VSKHLFQNLSVSYSVILVVDDGYISKEANEYEVEQLLEKRYCSQRVGISLGIILNIQIGWILFHFSIIY